MNVREALHLTELAAEIRKKIEGARLYGSPIDIDNVNHLIVAAYFQGLIDTDMDDENKMDLIDRVMV